MAYHLRRTKNATMDLFFHVAFYAGIDPDYDPTGFFADLIKAKAKEMQGQ